MREPIVIVGGGHAAGELAVALRQIGAKGRITIVSEEPYLPYQRPPLSKTWLVEDAKVDAVLLRPQSSYETAGIDVMLSERAAVIDRARKTVTLASGGVLPYGGLALATGARVRRLELPGNERAESCVNFHYLRTVDDVRRLRPQLVSGARLVVVGGGYIGLEVAAAAIKKGLEVTVLEAQPRVLARVTAPMMSSFYETVHRTAGVDLRTGTVVVGYEFDARGDRMAALLCRG